MDPINWHSVFFLVFALIACGMAVAVVVSSNIVRMAFYLILSLGAVSGLFFLAGADFVGALQLMIYVGGTLVLLAFGVMLTARGPFVNMEIGGIQWLVSLCVGAALLGLLVQMALWAGRPARGQAPRQDAVQTPLAPTAAPLGLGMLGVRVDRLDQENETLRSGMSGYLLPFEIISVHLLVVLIGAAYLARAKRRRSEAMIVSGNANRRGASPAVTPLTPDS